MGQGRGLSLQGAGCYYSSRIIWLAKKVATLISLIVIIAVPGGSSTAIELVLFGMLVAGLLHLRFARQFTNGSPRKDHIRFDEPESSPVVIGTVQCLLDGRKALLLRVMSVCSSGGRQILAHP